MKIFIALGFLFIFIFSTPCIADSGKEADNYCKDAESLKEWNELLSKHPQDDAICALYATRLGLCSMVESRTIDLDRATRIFEKMRESLITKYREQEEMAPGESKQAM
ncbi:MAG: hypothetical protein EOM44_14485 [Bacteroidia bacterium]|nr:hypothetical protein [Bacteroidia bacterium]